LHYIILLILLYTYTKHAHENLTRASEIDNNIPFPENDVLVETRYMTSCNELNNLEKQLITTTTTIKIIIKIIITEWAKSPKKQSVGVYF